MGSVSAHLFPRVAQYAVSNLLRKTSPYLGVGNYAAAELQAFTVRLRRSVGGMRGTPLHPGAAIAAGGYDTPWSFCAQSSDMQWVIDRSTDVGLFAPSDLNAHLLVKAREEEL